MEHDACVSRAGKELCAILAQFWTVKMATLMEHDACVSRATKELCAILAYVWTVSTVSGITIGATVTQDTREVYAIALTAWMASGMDRDACAMKVIPEICAILQHWSVKMATMMEADVCATAVTLELGVKLVSWIVWMEILTGTDVYATLVTLALCVIDSIVWMGTGMEIDVYVLRDTRERCATLVYLCLTASTDSSRERDASAMPDGQERSVTQLCYFALKFFLVSISIRKF